MTFSLNIIPGGSDCGYDVFGGLSYNLFGCVLAWYHRLYACLGGAHYYRQEIARGCRFGFSLAGPLVAFLYNSLFHLIKPFHLFLFHFISSHQCVFHIGACDLLFGLCLASAVVVVLGTVG